MRLHDPRHRVPRRQPRPQVHVQQLARRVLQAQPHRPHPLHVRSRTPPGLVVGQHHQADRMLAEAVVDAVVVSEHAPWERGISLGLDLEVDQEQRLGAVASGDLDELVGTQVAGLGVGDDGLQLAVQEGDRLGPVHEGRDVTKEQLDEGREVELKGQLPGGVEAVGLAFQARLYRVRNRVMQIRVRTFAGSAVGSRTCPVASRRLGHPPEPFRMRNPLVGDKVRPCAALLVGLPSSFQPGGSTPAPSMFPADFSPPLPRGW